MYVLGKSNKNALVMAVLATLIPQAYAYDNVGTVTTQQTTADTSVSNSGTIDLATPTTTYALQATATGAVITNAGLIENNYSPVGGYGTSNVTTNQSTALNATGNSSTINNSGTIFGLNGAFLRGTDISFTNSATGLVTAIGNWQYLSGTSGPTIRYAGIVAYADRASIYNYGTIAGGAASQAEAILTLGNYSYVYNAGIIKTDTSAANPNTIQNSGAHATLINMGKISAIGPNGPVAIYANSGEGFGASGSVNGSYDLIHNAGTIFVKDTNGSGGGAGIWNGWDGDARIAKINNIGSIVTEGVGTVGIFNEDRNGITELNNAQGVYGSGGSALTLAKNLPNNYNMIVYGNAYGQLAVQSINTTPDWKGAVSNNMTFGIFGGDAANGVAPSVLNSRNYLDVMTGVDVGHLNNTFTNGTSYGTYGGAIYALSDATWRGGVNTAWDLRVLNLSADLVVPQAGMLEQRTQAIRTSLGYDCNYFNENNICFTANARYSSYNTDSLGEGAGLLTAAILLNSNVRAGVFVDVGNVAEPKGIKLDNTVTTYGAFIGYAENKDGTGTQAKVVAAYQRTDADFTRYNISGTASVATGDANVSSFGILAQIGRGYAMANNKVITPYLGLGYARSKRDDFSDSGTGVGLAFSYNDYTLERTWAEAGIELKGKVEGQSEWPFYYRVGAALQHDIAYRLSDFNATGSVSGVNMLIKGSDGNNYIRARGFAGLAYEVKKGTLVGVDLNMQGLDNGDIASTILLGLRTSF